jgi:hypothetical protein
MAPIPNRPRQDVELYWRERVRAARIKYDLVIAESRKVLEEQTDLASPDATAALRRVRQQESLARDEYMRVLKIFTELTVDGKMPEEG